MSKVLFSYHDEPKNSNIEWTLPDVPWGVMITGLITTILFQAKYRVLVVAFKGDLWNCKVTPPPPFTAISNLKQ